MKSIKRIFVLLFVLAAMAADAAHAADPPKDKGKAAATDVSKADADFAYQGEFLGCAWVGNGCREYVGLQVVALGDGKFDIYHLRGGLPGAGWDRHTRNKIGGALKDGVLVGKNDQLAIAISPQQAILSNSAGAELGRLERILRVSPSAGAAAPPGAIVLFDGTPPKILDGAKLSPDGLLEIGSTTKMPVHDFQLHVEFKLPYMPYARGQGRANSGVYIQQRYELQILDSFGLEGIENECGSLYRQQRPELNMCFPPLSWQTYDIYFTAARFDSVGKKIANTRITVYQNGVPIHCNRDVPAKTGAGQKEAPEPRPIHFQNHGNPVQYRNLWIVPNDPAPSVIGNVASCQPACCQRTCDNHCGRRLFHGGRRCR